jgi:hypothetical protein
MALQQRDFFNEKRETRPASYTCPRCGHGNAYQVTWVRWLKKDRLRHGGDEPGSPIPDPGSRIPDPVSDQYKPGIIRQRTRRWYVT